MSYTCHNMQFQMLIHSLHIHPVADPLQPFPSPFESLYNFDLKGILGNSGYIDQMEPPQQVQSPNPKSWICPTTLNQSISSVAVYFHLDRVKRIWYLSPVRAAKVQASLRIRAVSPEPSLLAHTSSESRGTFRQKARSLAPLNGWTCAVEVCHDGMLEDTNSLDGAHFILSMRTWPFVKFLFVQTIFLFKNVFYYWWKIFLLSRVLIFLWIFIYI